MNKSNIIEEINSEIARITNEVSKEYEQFKNYCLSLTSIEVFEKAFKISSFTDFLLFFENDGFGNMIANNISLYGNNENELNQIFINLTKINQNILNPLYDTMINTNELYSNSWEDIETIITNTYF